MDHPVLLIAMRFVHIVSAVLAVGGLAALPLMIQPALRLVDETFGQSVLTLVRRRVWTWLWIGALGLVISGTYNWIVLAGTYKAIGPAGNALIGSKVLVAAIFFVLAWVRQAGLAGGSDKFWSMLLMHLAGLVILLGAVLRYFRLDYLNQPLPG